MLAVDLTLHERNKRWMIVSFEAQSGRTYVLWNSADIAGDEWIKVQAFPAEDGKRTVTYRIPDEHLPLPSGYYRLTIPATND